MSGSAGPGPLSRVVDALRGVASWIRGTIRGLGAWCYDGLMSFRSRAMREALLIGVAYVTGVAGVTISVLGDPTNPDSEWGSLGIALMGIAFTCLFLVSLSILRTTGGEVGDR
ncbi:hypothetical protein BRD00_14775 [Halobacteriales archaeon QS_8_69_26]|nr:MAG: hypothetical protein BRD00_14775 [Halobacteriales archaeon QS_8_69_26]